MSGQAPPLEGVGWSSSLSVAELAAIREAGFVPRGLVMGSSVYTIGMVLSPVSYGTWGYAGESTNAGRGSFGNWARSFPGWSKYYSGGELHWGQYWGAAVCWERFVFEDAIEKAASLATERIEAETVQLGAHGVIGTRLNFRYLEGLPSTIEFTAIGTAVARAGAEPLARPFTSHLSGQDLLKLLQAGMVPVAVAVGAGSVTAEITSMPPTGSLELIPFRDAIEMSRQIAAERLQRSARAGGWAVLGTLGSSGTQGADHSRTMTTVLIGTVVGKFATGTWSSLPLTMMRLSRP